VSLTCEKREHQCVIRLEGELDVACSGELKRCLVEAISHQKDLALDLSAATDVDVTALQLLWATMKAAEKMGKKVSVVSELPASIRTPVPRRTNRIAFASGFP
jgi:anti-anti-sigma factor